MTETEKQERIEQHRKYILNEAEEIAEALKDGDVEAIYTNAQYIISDYMWIETLEVEEVDEADS